MKKLGIIALEDERISKLKWYNINRRRITESFLLEGYETEAVAVYFGKRLNLLRQILSEHDIRVALCTERFKEKFGEISMEGIEVLNGNAVYKRLVPEIIKKVVKISGVKGDSASLAISEENSRMALSLVESLRNNFRYITIISKNKKNACEISEKILDEYGLPIFIADSDSKMNCDVVVKTGADTPNMSKDTILIDASAEHTITRKRTINWVNVTSPHNLPYKIDSLSFVEGIETVTGNPLNFKICGFRCGKKVVPTSALLKKY